MNLKALSRNKWVRMFLICGFLLLNGCNTYVGMDIGTGWANVGGLNVGGSVHIGRAL